MPTPGPRTTIEEEMEDKGVFKLKDPDSGKIYYLKRCTPEELKLTSRAAVFELPKDAIVVLPKIIDHHFLPIAILERARQWKPTEGCEATDADRTELLMTEAVPNNTLLSAIKNLPRWLKAKPITEQEMDTIIRDVRLLNEAGIFNHDLMSNLFVARDRAGKLHAYAIDFEPSGLGRSHPDAPLEDVAQLEGLKQEMIAVELLGGNSPASPRRT